MSDKNTLLDLGDQNNATNSIFKFFWDITMAFLKFMFMVCLFVFVLWLIYYTLTIIAQKINECGIENQRFATRKVSEFLAVANPLLVIIPNIFYRIIKKIQSLF